MEIVHLTLHQRFDPRSISSASRFRVFVFIFQKLLNKARKADKIIHEDCRRCLSPLVLKLSDLTRIKLNKYDVILETFWMETQAVFSTCQF